MARNDSPQEQYDQGYTGYKASKSKDDPYASHSQQQQQQYQAPDSYQQASYGQQQQQQQFASYQPPLSALEGEDASAPTAIGLNGHLAALLSYLLGWLVIPPIIAFIVERKNRFVRFAAAQSALFFIAVAIVYGILHFLGGFLGAIWIIGPLLGFVFGAITAIVILIAVLVCLYAMFQSYRGKTVRLPFFSGYAQALVDRTTRRRSV